MHVAIDHARISRELVKNSLEERRPGLINLPIPLPSIPILNPIVTPLVGGNNKPSPTPPPPSAPAPTPPPSSPPSSGGGGDSGNGNGGGTGNGNGNGDGNGNENGNGNGGGDGNGGSGGGGGTSGGNNGGNDPGSGNAGSGGSNTGNGGNTGTGSGSNNDSTNTGSSSPEQTGSSGNPSNSNGSSSGSSGSSDTPSGSSSNGESGDGTNGSQNGGSSSSGGGNGAVGNAGTNPNETNGGHGLKSAIATGTGDGSPNATGTSNPGVDGPGGNGGSGTGDSTSNGGGGGVSKGAVAAIAVIAVLAFLGLLVFLLRRRAISRRSDRRNRWWGKKDTATPRPQYGDRNSVDSTNSRTASVRSSFATTFDHGQTPRLTMDFGPMPPVPPMAEIRNGPVAEGQLFSPANDTPILVSFDNSHVSPTGETRYSTHSIQSNTSDGYSQYLVVANSGLIDSPEIRTPMSVRPFSPSESFAFPKPPTVQSGDWSNAGSRPQSSSTLATLKSPEISYLGSPIPPTPALPKDPFADPSKPEFVGVETICRPFVPTLGDELAVAIGDSVKVLNIFDDGWAMVEKVPEGTEVVKPQSGLIPIDCLRAVDQDLPAFMSERRVSIPYAESADGHTMVAL